MENAALVYFAAKIPDFDGGAVAGGGADGPGAAAARARQLPRRPLPPSHRRTHPPASPPNPGTLQQTMFFRKLCNN